MLEALALMLSVGGGTASPVSPRRDARLQISSIGGTETPLPEKLSPTGLRQIPTQSVTPSRAISSELTSVARVLSVASVLRVDAAAQARVDEILAASAKKPTTKRPLARRAVNTDG